MSMDDRPLPMLSRHFAQWDADQARLRTFATHTSMHGQPLLAQNLGDQLVRRYGAFGAAAALADTIARHFATGEQSAPPVDLLLSIPARPAHPPAPARWSASRWPAATGPAEPARTPVLAHAPEALLNDLTGLGWSTSEDRPAAPVRRAAADSLPAQPVLLTSPAVRPTRPAVLAPAQRAATSDVAPAALPGGTETEASHQAPAPIAAPGLADTVAAPSVGEIPPPAQPAGELPDEGVRSSLLRSAVATPPLSASLAAVDLSLVRPAGMRPTALLRQVAAHPLSRMGFAAPATPAAPIFRHSSAMPGRSPQPITPPPAAPSTAMSRMGFAAPATPAFVRSSTTPRGSMQLTTPPAATGAAGLLRQPAAGEPPMPLATAPVRRSPSIARHESPARLPGAPTQPTTAETPRSEAPIPAAPASTSPADESLGLEDTGDVGAAPAGSWGEQEAQITRPTRTSNPAAPGADSVEPAEPAQPEAAQALPMGEVVPYAGALRMPPFQFSQLLLRRMVAASGVAGAPATPDEGGAALVARSGAPRLARPQDAGSTVAHDMEPVQRTAMHTQAIPGVARLAAHTPMQRPFSPISSAPQALATATTAGLSLVKLTELAGLARYADTDVLGGAPLASDLPRVEHSRAPDQFSAPPWPASLPLSSQGIAFAERAASSPPGRMIARMPGELPMAHPAPRWLQVPIAGQAAQRWDAPPAYSAVPELAFAPPAALAVARASEYIQRQPAPSPGDSTAPQGATPAPQNAAAPTDPNQIERIASQVYDHLRRRLLIDHERRGRSM